MPAKKITPGKIYPVPSNPEWQVCCASEGCGSIAIVAGRDVFPTRREAETAAKRDQRNMNLQIGGWRKVNGLWYCRTHSAEIG